MGNASWQDLPRNAADLWGTQPSYDRTNGVPCPIPLVRGGGHSDPVLKSDALPRAVPRDRVHEDHRVLRPHDASERDRVRRIVERSGADLIGP